MSMFNLCHTLFFPGEEAMLQQQLLYDYNTRGHTSEFGDTSSTETLGPVVYQHDSDRINTLSLEKKHKNAKLTPHKDMKIKRGSPLPPDIQPIVPQKSNQLVARPFSVKNKSVSSRVLAFLRIFSIAFVLVVIALVGFVVFIFESDSKIMEGIRSSQEMVLLRIQYYEPIKRIFGQRPDSEEDWDYKEPDSFIQINILAMIK